MAMNLLKQAFRGALTVLLLCWTTTTMAQDGTISGSVIDPNGAVVVGATVELINLASNRIRSTKTDGSGKYEFTGLPDGRYRLVVKAAGYNDSGRTITIVGSTLTEDVQLSVGTIQDVITVTAGRSLEAEQDIPQNVTVVTAQAIEERVPTSAADVIKVTPSLFIFNPGPQLGSPNLRGLQASRVLIVIDGERVNNASTEPQTFGAALGSFVDTFQVENAEVVAGAGSSLYGTDSLVGTVNFTTKAPIRSTRGWIVGMRFQGLFSQNEDGRKGNVTLNISNPWIAFNLSGSLYRYGYYHFGNTGGDVPLDAVKKQQDFLKFISGNTGNRIDFALSQEWSRRFANLGVLANATQTTVINSQAHGADGTYNLWFYPHANHWIRYKQINNHLGSYGYPGQGPPWEPQYNFASFEKNDQYGARYQGVELNSIISRIAAGFYRRYYYRPIDSLSFLRTNRLAPGSTATLDTYVRPAALTFSKTGVVTTGVDGQASLQFATNNTLLVGYQFWRDRAAAELAIVSYNSMRSAPGGSIPPWAPLDSYFLQPGGSYGKGTPDGYVQESALFFQDEYEPSRWLRLVGSFRYSRFTTKLIPAQGFPLPGFDIAINGPFPPGIDGAGIMPLAPIVTKTGNVTFDRNVYTGSLAIIGRPWSGISVFGRIGNSFRQPGMNESFLFRGFPAGTFAFIFAPNGNLKPERGVNVDTGVKVNHKWFRASATYFNNTYTNFIDQSPFFVQPGGPGSLPERLGFQSLFWIQRFNVGRARIHGLETDFDVPLDLNGHGTLTISGAMSWLHSEDLLPLPSTFRALERQYQANVREGKELFDFGERALDANGNPRFSDVPFERVVPFLGSWNVRLQDKLNRFWTEYEGRSRTRIKRLDTDIQENFARFNYFSWHGMAGVTVHTWRFGYTRFAEDYRTSFTVSLDNIGNKFYTDPFQRGPARGRSVIFGVILDTFDLLKLF
ncbi:MAG: TonB-dependent receptor [Acidobacteria bacterium]|nr:TonB-dependent receptor [Acidobacteriota bacterium]